MLPRHCVAPAMDAVPVVAAGICGAAGGAVAGLCVATALGFTAKGVRAGVRVDSIVIGPGDANSAKVRQQPHGKLALGMSPREPCLPAFKPQRPLARFGDGVQLLVEVYLALLWLCFEWYRRYLSCRNLVITSTLPLGETCN